MVTSAITGREQQTSLENIYQSQSAMKTLAELALELGIDATPVVGDIAQVNEIITGKTLVTQEELSPTMRIIMGLTALIPFASTMVKMSIPQKAFRQVRPLWKKNKRDYLGSFPDDPPSQRYMDKHSDKRNRWNLSAKQAVSEGKLSQAHADKKGLVLDAEYKDMPEDLYHATPEALKVRQEGLKTRQEIGYSEAKGLGGGSSDTISFTTDRNIAKAVQRGLLEANLVLNKKISPLKLLKDAETGHLADKPYLEDMMKYWKRDWKSGDPLPSNIEGLLKNKEFEQPMMPLTAKQGHEVGRFHPGPWKPSGPPLTKEQAEKFGYTDGVERWWKWERDLSEKEYDEKLMDVYKKYSFWRENAGGPYDPMFFAENTDAVKNINPRDVRVIELTPEPGAKGYPVSGMKEWRTNSGKAVREKTKIEKIVNSKLSPTEKAYKIAETNPDKAFLIKKRKEAKELAEKLQAEGKYDEAMQVATDGQMWREAMEKMEGQAQHDL